MKRCIFFLAFLALALLHEEARAFSLQLRGGGGVQDADFQADTGFFSQAGLDLFIYEGERIQLFVGGEYTNLQNRGAGKNPNPLITGPGNNNATEFSVNIIASTIGLSLGLLYSF